MYVRVRREWSGQSYWDGTQEDTKRDLWRCRERTPWVSCRVQLSLWGCCIRWGKELREDWMWQQHLVLTQGQKYYLSLTDQQLENVLLLYYWLVYYVLFSAYFNSLLAIVCLHLWRDNVHTEYLNSPVNTHNCAGETLTTANFLQNPSYDVTLLRWHPPLSRFIWTTHSGYTNILKEKEADGTTPGFSLKFLGVTRSANSCSPTVQSN